VSEPPQKPGKSEQSVGTPWEFIHAVENRFGRITFDIAADASNAKAPAFFTEADDAIAHDWRSLVGKIWCNPPFGDINRFAEKCASKVGSFGEQDAIFLLVPASVGANWYWDFVAPRADVYALSPRLKFIGHADPYPKDLILAVFGKHTGGVFKRWKWKS